MKKNVIVAPYGKDLDNLFLGVREFATEKIVLITPADRRKDAEKVRKDFERFKIPIEIREIKEENVWEGTFKAVADIKEIEKDKEIIINTAVGDPGTSRCAACSAAFVNGLKAFGVSGSKITMLPIMKFSYYKILTNKKLEIMKTIDRCEDCTSSLERLSKATKMSLPLISYHINGNLKSEGLKQLGLIETSENKGRISVKLTTMGKLMLEGYVK